MSEIECYANRGHKYKVTFDGAGSVQRVESEVWQPSCEAALIQIRKEWRTAGGFCVPYKIEPKPK